MKVKLYAVLDTASGVYDGPIPCNTDGVAIRNFSNMAGDQNHSIGKNPEFFQLYRIGEYNDATGEITDEPKRCICKAIDVYNEIRAEIEINA